MNPALNGSSALQRFERGNAVEIRNRIMFGFYPGLPHVSYTSNVAGPLTFISITAGKERETQNACTCETMKG